MTEIGDLEGLYADRVPPPRLEEALREELLGEGLLESRSRRWIRRALFAGAAALIFLSGYQVRGLSAGDGSIPPDHVLLLWEGPGFRPGTPGDLRGEYARWMQESGAADAVLDGFELVERTRWFGRDAEVGVSDEGGLALSGFFLLSADDSTAARAAASHPHLRHGGQVEVRALR